MGAKESKQQRVSGQHNQPLANGSSQSRNSCDPYSEDDPYDDCNCAVPFFANSKIKKKEDAIGSPMPDTPLVLRRNRRDAAKTGNYGFLDLEETDSHGHVVVPPPLPRAENTNKRYKRGHGHNDYSSVIDWTHHNASVHEGPRGEAELLKKYDMGEVLGVGSTSTCHRCTDRNTGQVFACKIIHRVVIEKRFKGLGEQFQNEISTLKSLNHPNIISLYDVYTMEEKIFIIMELMTGGELFDYVVQKGTLTEDEASGIVKKVVSALVYMHDKNIIHRDLKPENLLLVRKPRSPLDLEVKIIDFGLSKRLEGQNTQSFLGTRGYLAPEMLQRQVYSRAVDAWALGVIVFVLLCGCLPFDDETQYIPPGDIVSEKFRLRFPRWSTNLSDSAKDLLTRLLDINPITRLTAAQALNHPWVTGHNIPKDNYLHSPGKMQLTPSAERSLAPRLPVAIVKDHTSRHFHHHNRNYPGDSSNGRIGKKPTVKMIRKYSI